MNDKKNKSQNIKNNMNSTQEEQILILLHNKLDNKYINIPNDENIKLILQNDYIKNMILFTLNKHSELEKDLKIRKKISFYYINNQKIDEYIKKKSIKSEKEKKILELKNKLNNIREQRSKYKIENNKILKEINDDNKKDKLARIKLKILNNISSTYIADLQKEYKKYSYINGYKYSHLYPQKKIGSVIENENDIDKEDIEKKEDFDKIINNEEDNNDNVDSKNNKNEEQVTFISNEMSSSLNDSKINQIINLPKLSDEEVIKYTKYTQKLFFEKVISDLKNIKKSLSLEDKNETNKNSEKEVISMISDTDNSKDNKLQKSKDIIAVENKIKQKLKNKDENLMIKSFFNEISEKFRNDIQLEELNVSKKYKNKLLEDNNDITYKQAIEEMNNIHKENNNKINTKIIQKIIDISKVKLIMDINDKIMKEKKIKKEKIDETIIPKCIIEKNPQDQLNFYRNVINTYKKYKLRTNNFINKRLFPNLLLLDEKYTDFLTTFINEYDYFTKLNFEKMKPDNDMIYSLKKFRYDSNLLKKNGINNKYDLFGLYIGNIFLKLKKSLIDYKTNSLNNSKSIKNFFEINNKSGDIIKKMKSFIKNAKFNEDFNLYFNKDELNLIREYMNEFFNIDYIKFLNPIEP